MLTEIICNKFRKNKIIFEKGVNVVVGDGSNSIGKSTLLLVVDFIFGGSAFIEKNKATIRHIGEHEYNFSFIFDKPYFFKRSTKSPKDVYECDENYKVLKTIDLGSYKEFLKQKYIPNLADLSFRDFVGTFCRIWGKGNDEVTFDLKPLHAHSMNSMKDCLVRVIKIFNQYSELKFLTKDRDGKDKELKSAKKLFGTDFLPTNIKKGQYTNNKEAIKQITTEVQDIKVNLAAYSVSIRDITDREVMKLKEEKDSLLNYKFELQNKHNSLQNNLTSNKHFKTKGIVELQEILPNIDTERLALVEAFHNDVLKILSKDLKVSLKDINAELKDLDDRLNQINDEVSKKFESLDTPTTLVDRVYDLATNFSKFKSENDLYDKVHDLKEDVRDLSKSIDETITEELLGIKGKINAGIYKLCHDIYGDNYKSPVFEANSKSYSYVNRDNTGTGAASFGLIVFDMTILRLTELPLLIHDSRMFNSLESRAIDKLLPFYNNLQKQTFIALDDIDKLSPEAQKLIKENEVISLCSSFTLYNKIWKETK